MLPFVVLRVTTLLALLLLLFAHLRSVYIEQHRNLNLWLHNQFSVDRSLAQKKSNAKSALGLVVTRSRKIEISENDMCIRLRKREREKRQDVTKRDKTGRDKAQDNNQIRNSIYSKNKSKSKA